jgi:hypothetical protein
VRAAAVNYAIEIKHRAGGSCARMWRVKCALD